MAIFQFTLVKGHQVASGIANDPRFVKGTIAAQLPLFQTLGLDIESFHRATLNAKFDCNSIILNHYDYYFKQVKWHKQMPAEDFKFCRCHILANEKCYPAIIYQPQAVTKTEHFHAINQLELIAPFIANISYGDSLMLDMPNTSITLVFT
tara:strand:- start:7818 stop:8267 length:450 start_codon:yes stop_codon:yes gene_type:complete